MSKTSTRMIRNLSELCALMGAGECTIESLSRRVYKSTDCGAWAAAIAPGWVPSGRRHTRVSVLGMPSLRGWTIHAIRLNGRAVFDIGKRYTGPTGTELGTPKVDRMVPQEVLAYVQAQEERLPVWGRKVYTCDQDASECLRRTLHDQEGKGDGFTVDRFRAWERVRFELPVTNLVFRGQGGVTVGSIVEGTEACTQTHELLFPFTEKTWWDTLDQVEKEADSIWNETHGCESCGAEGEYGGPAINPDCPVCHGEGVIL